MKLSVLLTTLLLAGPSAQECDSCVPKKLCKPHAEAVAEGLSGAKAGLRSKSVEERREALERIGTLNATHVNAPSKDVTKLIAGVLEDDDLPLRAEAARLLARGQEPETALKALTGSVNDIGQLLGKHKQDDADSEHAKAFSIAVINSLASYPDDRSVEALSQLLARHAAAIYGEVVYSVIDGLAALGTRDAVESVLGYYALMESLGAFPELENHLHDRLTELAERHGLEDTPASESSKAWLEWYEPNEKAFPKKLGKFRLQ